MKIKQLPPETVRKIAAGEVVERPASIVKELIENSIDAGATQINIEVKNGGIDYISVSDNGGGIEKEDLALTTQLHATSKISSIEDLNELLTMGFRGEALASIDAAANVEITSNAQGSKDAYRFSDGETTPAARSQGTTIIVKDLFRKIPARRKFLKTANTEENNIRNLVRQFAVFHNEIGFTYTAEGNKVFELKSEGMKSRIANLFTAFTAEDLIDIDTEENGIKITGTVVHPRKATRKAQTFIAINDRVIRSYLINTAVKKAYSNKIPPELNPHFFLNLKLDKKEVDVNVHPRKEEVKFGDESLVFKSVLKGIENILGDHMRSEFNARFGKEVHQAEELPENKPVYISPKATYSQPKNSSYEDAMTFSKNILSDSAKPERIEVNNFTKLVNIKFLQIFQTYILIEKDDKLLIIDQHAADERVKYEAIKQKNTDKLKPMPLLLPESVKLPGNADIETTESLIKELEKLGFRINMKSDIELEITELPVVLAENLQLKSMFEELWSLFEEKEDSKGGIVHKFIDRIFATIACHSSIRAGETLSTPQVEKLVSDLWDCQDPYTCPHGRPIVNEYKRSELEKMFKRVK